MFKIKEPVMKRNFRFKVHVKDRFEAYYDTIKKARDCRKALESLDYENIIITIEDVDVNPYEK